MYLLSTLVLWLNIQCALCERMQKTKMIKNENNISKLKLKLKSSEPNTEVKRKTIMPHKYKFEI